MANTAQTFEHTSQAIDQTTPLGRAIMLLTLPVELLDMVAKDLIFMWFGACIHYTTCAVSTDIM